MNPRPLITALFASLVPVALGACAHAQPAPAIDLLAPVATDGSVRLTRNASLVSDAASGGGVLVDSTRSEHRWNEGVTLHPGALEPGKRYEVQIEYRVVEHSGDDVFFYLVPKAVGDPSPWLQMITWQGDAGEGGAVTQRVLLPEAGGWQAILGVHGRGAVEVHRCTMREVRRLTRDELLADGETVAFRPGGAAWEPFGVCQHGEKDFYRSEAEVEQAFDLLERAGVQWVRISMSWAQLQPDGPDTVSEEYVDRLDLLVDAAEARGIKAFMQLFYTPRWASTKPDASAHWAYPPADLEPWRAFVRYMVGRYGDRVRHWEIGNEVDWHFWLADLEHYMPMLQAAHAEIKAIDPEHLVMAPALATDGMNTNDISKGGEINALQRLYDMGLAAYTDIISDHFYPRDAEHAVYRVNRIHAIMARNGDADKPIWITETGMPTGDPRFTEADQARLVTEMYHALTRHPHVEKIFWWNLRNVTADTAQRIGTYGLVEHDFTPRPSFEAFVNMPKPDGRRVNQVLVEVE